MIDILNALTFLVSVALAFNISLVKLEAPEITTEEYAQACGITIEEFVFLSSVVEAESNRSTDGDLEGRIFIAVTIINRVNSEYFPDTIDAVLTQRGQFSTVRNHHSITDRTQWSDEAVLQAFERLEAGEIPDNILFFRAGHYFAGYEQYGNGPIGGNYFSLYGG